MLEDVKQLFTPDPVFVSGVAGSMIQVMRRKLTLTDRIVTFVTSLSGVIFLAPMITHKLGYDGKEVAQMAIAFITGFVFNEVLQILFKVLDEIENNPKFIVSLLKKWFNVRQEKDEDLPQGNEKNR